MLLRQEYCSTAIACSHSLQSSAPQKLIFATALYLGCKNFFRTACSGLRSAASRRPHISLAQPLTICSVHRVDFTIAAGQDGLCFSNLLLSSAAAAAKCEGAYRTIFNSQSISSATYWTRWWCRSSQLFPL